MAKKNAPRVSVYSDAQREKQRLKPLWEGFWPEFEKKAKSRLRRGHREYSDISFDRPLSSLLRETEEEIYDQILWSFIALTRLSPLWGRIQRLENAIGAIEVEERLMDQPIPDLTNDPFGKEEE